VFCVFRFRLAAAASAEAFEKNGGIQEAMQ
jgi:hypothetical protein